MRAFRRWSLVRLSAPLWLQLLSELERRGDGRRESGAFLLGGATGNEHVVTRIVFFDDLDPHCLKGHIHMVGTAFSLLWDICEDEGLRVIADVHTHPGKSVAQSSIDAGSPAMARSGHVALIVPNLAVGAIKPSSVGVHLYRGNAGWKSWFGRRASMKLDVSGS